AVVKALFHFHFRHGNPPSGTEMPDKLNQLERMFLPTIVEGALRPNSARMVGARSTSEGEPVARGRFANRTPGTSSESAQWSALQAESLSSSTSGVRSPRQVAHEARKPR